MNDTASLDSLDALWRSGYRAYEAKIARQDCVFEGSRARKEWESGWDHAKDDYETASDEE